MLVVDIDEAKAHLSRLIDQAAKGDPFIIASSGKPMVKVIALSAAVGGHERWIGFLRGQISMPEDFDRMGAEEIERLFSAD